MADQSGLGFTVPREQPAPQPETIRFARLSAIQASMRSHLNPFGGTPSSVYSRSPNPNLSTVNGPSTTPKPPFRFFGRWGETQSPSESVVNLSIDPQPVPLSYSPAVQPSEWGQQPNSPAEPDRMFILDSRRTTQIVPQTGADVDLESGTVSHQPRRHHKRRRRHADGTWVRSHRHGTSRHGSNPLHHDPKQAKYLPALISAIFLMATIATYLAIALSVKGLGQEIHILFVLTITGTTIFFCYSMVRICMRKQRPTKRPTTRRRRPHHAKELPKDGFKPDVPIRVHLARDDEIAAQNDDGSLETEKMSAVKMPPPAYGLWRCSVKADPSLIHWQRVGPAVSSAATSPGGSSANGSTVSLLGDPVANQQQQQQVGPRPPSYISDDGVSYVMTAEPRSTVSLQRPPTELHPAFQNRLFRRS